MELTYTMQGDYRLPNLIPPESPKVGKYGMLRLALRLRFAVNVFDDALAGFGVVASGVAALPATIAAFADVTFTVGAFLGH